MGPPLPQPAAARRAHLRGGAIQAHDGQGAAARNAFNGATAAQRNDLLLFLSSL